MKTISLDLTVFSPDGKALSLVVTGDLDQVGFMEDILENTQEYLEWLRGERLGECPNGFVH